MGWLSAAGEACSRGYAWTASPTMRYWVCIRENNKKLFRVYGYMKSLNLRDL
jgi:hypothetical protein